MESKNNLIYFNTNRSTKIDPLVSEAMLNWRNESPETQAHLEQEAVQEMADLLNCGIDEFLFTKGTSESIELAIQAVFETSKIPKPHFICSNTEHPAVLKSLQTLVDKGAELSYLHVNREGLIDVADLKNVIQANTVMICLMAANNETGVIQPIEEVANFCRQKNILFFSDASQYIGKLRYDAEEFGIDLLAFGAHKMYGPEGIGLLYISNQHSNLLNYIKNKYTTKLSGDLKVGFGRAARLFQETHWELGEHLSRLKNYFEHQLLDIEGLRINGSTRHRLYNTSNLTFPENLVIENLLEEFEFAHNLKKPSYVLKAMGLSGVEIKCSFRFSFGKYNTLEEVKNLVEKILFLQSY